MSFLIYLIVLFLLLGDITANKVVDSLIQDSCKKAAKDLQPHIYKFCITSIKENPESRNVRNIDELTVVGLKNAMSNLTNVKGIVEKIVKERKYKSKLSEKMLRYCLKLYSEGNNFLTKALEYVKMRDYKKVYTSLNDALTVPRTCEMGFNDDNHQISPVKKENDVLFELIGLPTSFNYNAHIQPSPSNV